MFSNLKKYNETENYLYGLQKHGIKLGLENSRGLMCILGEPQKSFHSVHIAGTNGKGSTASIIASILKETGVKVGLYTSPHLISFTERIKINNSPVLESDVIRLVSIIREAITNADINPTFFEFVTAMALYYFARKKVDWAVVEVGMGGRLDATNILLPDISVITNISLEHREVLGESLSAIAAEKAGIIKPSVPVVTATTHHEALKVLEGTARDRKSEIHIIDRDFKGILSSMNEGRIVFDYIGINPLSKSRKEYRNLALRTSGRHQVLNASVALRTCEMIESKGLMISDEAVKNGLLNSDFSGRLEWSSRTPPVLIDSAHNPEAAAALADTVKEIFLSKKIILIMGIMNDKDTEGILKPLIQISDVIILTKPKGERAASPEKLKEGIKSLEKKGSVNFRSAKILTTSTVAEALELAKKICRKDQIILVTGSFYTTGEVKELSGNTSGVLSQLRE